MLYLHQKDLRKGGTLQPKQQTFLESSGNWNLRLKFKINYWHTEVKEQVNCRATRTCLRGTSSQRLWEPEFVVEVRWSKRIKTNLLYSHQSIRPEPVFWTESGSNTSRLQQQHLVDIRGTASLPADSLLILFVFQGTGSSRVMKAFADRGTRIKRYAINPLGQKWTHHNITYR